MTLPAVDSWNVHGLKGEALKVGPRCSQPACGRFAEHAHHIVRRSQLGGAFDWVEIDGVVYANKTGLCVEHHDDVTGRTGGHRAAIRLVEDGWSWCGVETRPDGAIVYLPFAPLDPQPPTPDSLARASNGTGSDNCPFCGQQTRRRAEAAPPKPPRGRRRRKSWCIEVPDDHEDGADVLDALVDDLALLLGITPNRTGRYFVVVPTLVYAQQDRKAFLDSLAGVGG
jgi:hypothetical protein